MDCAATVILFPKGSQERCPVFSIPEQGQRKEFLPQLFLWIPTFFFLPHRVGSCLGTLYLYVRRARSPSS